MENPRIKKGLGVIILLLFLSTTCLPIVNADEGKPDFVIEDIFLWPSSFPNEYHFEYRLNNIGDSPIYSFELETNIKIQWMLLSRIPLFTIVSYVDIVNLGALIPGKTINLSFISCDYLPKFGTYRFSLTVNPHKTIEESNYDNNKYSEDWKVFLWNWKEIG